MSDLQNTYLKLITVYGNAVYYRSLGHTIYYSTKSIKQYQLWISTRITDVQKWKQNICITWLPGWLWMLIVSSKQKTLTMKMNALMPVDSFICWSLQLQGVSHSSLWRTLQSSVGKYKMSCDTYMYTAYQYRLYVMRTQLRSICTQEYEVNFCSFIMFI